MDLKSVLSKFHHHIMCEMIRPDPIKGTHTAEVVKKAHKRLYFLRVLRKNNIPEKLFVSYYHCTVESILVSFSSCTVAQKRNHCRVIRVAQQIVSCPLPSFKELHNSHTESGLRNIKKIPQHPSLPDHDLFQSLLLAR